MEAVKIHNFAKINKQKWVKFETLSLRLISNGQKMVKNVTNSIKSTEISWKVSKLGKKNCV